ncbi:MAG: BON domain-containing protein [Dokdonella sp.]
MTNRSSLLAFAVASSLMLSGGAAFAAQQAPDGEMEKDKSEQPVTDTWITTKVKAELATTDGVKSTDISVTTVDGVVTLGGMLASPTGVEKAVAAAKSIKGVKSVDSSALKSS